LDKALASFIEILHILPLIGLEKKEQQQEVVELIEICKEYMTALRLESARLQVTDAARQILLGAYVTRCKLQAMHLILALRSAIQRSYQAKNYKTCGGFCRRVLELCVTSNKNQNFSKVINVDQIRNVLKACEKTNADSIDVKYSETDTLILCCESFTPLGNITTSACRCPYCQSTYKTEYKNSLCRTCQLSKIGAEATGLRCYPEYN